MQPDAHLVPDVFASTRPACNNVHFESAAFAAFHASNVFVNFESFPDNDVVSKCAATMQSLMSFPVLVTLHVSTEVS